MNAFAFGTREHGPRHRDVFEPVERPRSSKLRMRRLSMRAALIASVVATTSLSPFTASAQPQPAAPNPDTMKEIARQRYNDGVKAYDASKWDEARLAFSQSYELTKLPVVLLNLGMSEVKGNHPVEGGNHLLQFLREYKEAKPDQTATANGGIEEAKKKAALVSITVNANGADVSIDGALVGKSPIADPVFVAEGARTVVASLNGASGMSRVEAKKGTPASAAVVIQGASPEPLPPVGPTQPVGPSQPMNPVGPTQPYNPNGFQPPPPASTQGESFGHWYSHKPLAWVGTGLTVVGLGLGIGFSAAAASATSKSNSIADQIRGHVASNDPQTSGPPCSNTGGADTTGYGTACTKLRDSMSTHNVDVGVAVGGWVVFGLAAAGTVTYAMVDWFPKRKGTTTDQAPQQGPTVEPIVGLGYGGMRGSF